MDLNVVCTVSSVDTGMALNALAGNRSTVAEAHIQVDTGMGFGGFLVSEPEKILLAYRSLPNVALTGIYTQLHGTAPRGLEASAQLEQFQQVLEAIHTAGSRPVSSTPPGPMPCCTTTSPGWTGCGRALLCWAAAAAARMTVWSRWATVWPPSPRCAGCPRDTRWAAEGLSP